ncbi:MAG: cytochrome c3 family protein [Armatimonadota bacterium]
MPFQVTRSNRIALLIWLVAMAPLLLLMRHAAWADNGLYGGTAHGNPATGVRRDPTLPTGSCRQCHTGHGAQNFGLWAADDNNLCFTCHGSAARTYPGQTGYQAGGHSASTSMHDSRPVGLCVQCHNPHGTGDTRGAYPKLTGQLEEQACFICHGDGPRPANAANIQARVTSPYAHRVADYERLHDDWNESNAMAFNPNPLMSGANRHVECADCHNPHSARTATRPVRSSNIGEMLLGGWGVRPTFPAAAWTEPLTYTVERFTDTTKLEYYLCLKCHSNWSWGTAAPFTTDGTRQTNMALEINPANPAYHNVTGQAAVDVPSDDVIFGTATPPDYANGWGPNSALACTDCHADALAAGNARGAHGSTHNYLLKKRFKASAGALDNTGATGTQNDLCFECHHWNTYGAGGIGTGTNFSAGAVNLHALSSHAQAGCFSCHAAIPHGFKRKHMIVYATDEAPYYQGDPLDYVMRRGGIVAYAPADGSAYTANNCQTGCHHTDANPVNPLP